MNDASPIVAIATPPGRGGIGVVRVSGLGLAPLVQALLGRTPAARLATLTAFPAADGKPIDRGLVLWFPAPHSYTGEDVLELHGHGGPVVMRLLLARVLEVGVPLGVRIAAPGEFTERAFLNDKLDLAQAEAVADLIDASTEAAARGAARSLEGDFSRRVRALVDTLIELRMLTEATLDFPEEEIDFLKQADAYGRLARVRSQLDALLSSARQGALLREGLSVVLVGEPNVGKSSLLNALAGSDVAIVTPIAGTTRDRVVERIQIEGIPLNVIDTAGLREAGDEVERIGIERTWDAVGKADVVLRLEAAIDGEDADDQVRMDELVAPSFGAAGSIDAQLVQRLPRGVPVVRVVNKVDLTGEAPRVDADGVVWLSAKTGDGIELLRARLLQIAGWEGAGEGAVLARERHLAALREASQHLATADALLQETVPGLELFAEELRLGQRALDRITGAFSADDLLGEIFGRFCIGK